jgi:hypothetical protein
MYTVYLRWPIYVKEDVNEIIGRLRSSAYDNILFHLNSLLMKSSQLVDSFQDVRNPFSKGILAFYPL